MTNQIDPTSLHEHATKFLLGRYEVDSLTGTPPVYLEKISQGWVIRAEHPDSMNPHYLHEKEPHWRYKRGTAFESKEEAIDCFNTWLMNRQVK